MKKEKKYMLGNYGILITEVMLKFNRIMCYCNVVVYFTLVRHGFEVIREDVSCLLLLCKIC